MRATGITFKVLVKQQLFGYHYFKVTAKGKVMPKDTDKQLGVTELNEKLEKLKSFAQSLKGKELQLAEKQLRQKELQLKLYRKNILLAIKEQLEDRSYDESVKILEKYKEILQFVAEDIQEDIDDIMG